MNELVQFGQNSKILNSSKFTCAKRYLESFYSVADKIALIDSYNPPPPKKKKKKLLLQKKKISNLLIKNNVHNRPTNVLKTDIIMLYTNTFANETDVRLLLILVIRLARSKTDLKCILKIAENKK